MTTVTLKYTSSGTTYSRNFDVPVVRGFEAPDEFKIVGVQNRYLDGSVEEIIRGFQRVITIDFGTLTDVTDKEFIWNFLQNPARTVRLGTDVIFAAIGEM